MSSGALYTTPSPSLPIPPHPSSQLLCVPPPVPRFPAVNVKPNLRKCRSPRSLRFFTLLSPKLFHPTAEEEKEEEEGENLPPPHRKKQSRDAHKCQIYLTGESGVRFHASRVFCASGKRSRKMESLDMEFRFPEAQNTLLA